MGDYLIAGLLTGEIKAFSPSTGKCLLSFAGSSDHPLVAHLEAPASFHKVGGHRQGPGSLHVWHVLYLLLRRAVVPSTSFAWLPTDGGSKIVTTPSGTPLLSLRLSGCQESSRLDCCSSWRRTSRRSSPPPLYRDLVCRLCRACRGSPLPAGKRRFGSCFVWPNLQG